MIIYEYKAYGSPEQEVRIREAIRTTQFVRNKCLRLWLDARDSGNSPNKYALNTYCAVLAKEFEFANKLNSMARQAAAERAWSAIHAFYKACQAKKAGSTKKIGYPRFQKDARSVEYKTTGWKLEPGCRGILFTDKHGIGRLRLKGGREVPKEFFSEIKRVRLVRKADGFYVQIAVNQGNTESVLPTGNSIGLDVGLNQFYVDSNNNSVENPRFARKSAAKLKFLQRKLARKPKPKKNKPETRSKRRNKAVKQLAKQYLKVARQRKDFAVKTARHVMLSNDFVAIEDLQVSRMTRSAKGTVENPGRLVRQKAGLNRSMNDVAWRAFRVALESYALRFGKVLVAVDPAYTTQACSQCGCLPSVAKTLADRQHECEHCGVSLNRDYNAALNILRVGLHSKVRPGRPEAGNSHKLVEEPSDLPQGKQALLKRESPLL